MANISGIPAGLPIYQHNHRYRWTEEGNPYATFRLCCTKFRTKDHAQLIGVLSFSMFICLVMLSLFFFGLFSIFYIIVGIIVYSLLMRSVFNTPDKFGVLSYLAFEALQIGALIVFLIYTVTPLVFGPPHRVSCDIVIRDGVKHQICRIIDESSNVYERTALVEMLVCLLILTTIKHYFIRVFSCYYKYLIYAERKSHTAHYFNSQGVRINVDDIMFGGRYGAPPPFPPPPSAWANGDGSVKLPEEYLLQFGHFPELPSYSQVSKKNTDHIGESSSPSTSVAASSEEAAAAPANFGGKDDAAERPPADLLSAPPQYSAK